MKYINVARIKEDMEKKQVSFRLEQNIIKSLKFLAVEQDKTLTELFL